MVGEMVRLLAVTAAVSVACGGKTPLPGEDDPYGSSRQDGGAGRRISAGGGTGGIAGAPSPGGSSTGGRTNGERPGSPGTPSPGTGGGPGQPAPPAGGSPSATGGFSATGGIPATPEPATGGAAGRPAPPPPQPPPPQPPPRSDFDRLLPYACLSFCDGPRDCPRPDPYTGGCNSLTGGCTLLCDNGCPPGLEETRVAGGCFCYQERFNRTDDQCCSFEDCGAPWHLPCCGENVCRSGRCVDR